MTHAEIPKRPPRLLPIDALRGFIIVVMAIDHANAFIAHGKLQPEMWAGGFPNYRGDVVAFLTRLITHLAAPGFFFLMGASMALLALSRLDRGWSHGRIISYFVIRGGILIAVQFLLENPAWQLEPNPPPGNYFGVMFALGGTMILGAFLLWLPKTLLIGLSAVLIISIQFLLIRVTGSTFVISITLVPGFMHDNFVLYPILPWLGVVGLGIAYGYWLKQNSARVLRVALWIGLVTIIAFILLRALNGYGNMRPMIGKDWIAFLNGVKYPPSVTFLLFSLGADLILLGIFTWTTKYIEKPLRVLAVFGSASLFFYVMHLYLYAFIGNQLNFIQPDIPHMYPYWLLGLVILFPLCWLYGRFKQSRGEDSLWRLF